MLHNCTAELGETSHPRADIEDMKTALWTSENGLVEVTEQATARIIEARQIKHGADREFVQAMTTIQQLEAHRDENNTL